MRYARICPNTNGWVSPSGPPKWSPKSFPDNGFGFDEWMLGTPLIAAGEFAGYRAGFIQGFKQKRNRVFSTDVTCYWIDGTVARQAHEAIVIRNCRSLSTADATAILAAYTAVGFIQAMANSLNALPQPLNPGFPADPLDMFNVVFKDGDQKLIAPPNPINNRGFQYRRLFN